MLQKSQAFILHARPYLETSLLLTCFSKDQGKISVLAKGVKRSKNAWRGILRSFYLLEIDCVGKQELLTLSKAELLQGFYHIQGNALLSGLHVNELLLKLLPVKDAHPELFDKYLELMQNFNQATFNPALLRQFELYLLTEMGYGLDFIKDANQTPICSSQTYEYILFQGFVPSLQSKAHNISGEALLAIAQNDYEKPLVLQQAKILLRCIFQQLFEDNPLKTRECLQSF